MNNHLPMNRGGVGGEASSDEEEEEEDNGGESATELFSREGPCLSLL